VAAHNLEHEAKFWGEPSLPVLCTFKAAMRVWPAAPSFGNGALRYWLEDQGLTAPDHAQTMPPHRAGPDAYVTACTLAALLTQVTAKEMVAWTREPACWPTCPIGEWRGKPWAEVDAGFLRWMVNKPVEPDLVWNAKRELDRRHA
jgi:exodeoxyribonuclease X